MSEGDEEKRETITSLEALRKRVPVIVNRLNADPALALRAAANPLLVLEELGYHLSDALKAEAALRIRFDDATRKRLQVLTAEIHSLAGEVFVIDSPDELGHVLYGRLQLPPLPLAKYPAIPSSESATAVPAQRAVARESATAAPPDPLAIPYRRPGGIRPPDPLEALAEAHAIIAPLLEYRAIQAGEPPLAGPALYAAIKDAQTGTIKLRIKAVLKRGPKPE